MYLRKIHRKNYSFIFFRVIINTFYLIPNFITSNLYYLIVIWYSLSFNHINLMVEWFFQKWRLYANKCNHPFFSPLNGFLTYGVHYNASWDVLSNLHTCLNLLLFSSLGRYLDHVCFFWVHNENSNHFTMKHQRTYEPDINIKY